MNDAQEKDKEELDVRGLRCQKCGCGQFRVIYTRPAHGAKLVRRRECRNCQARITTWERVIG
jgi:transcriptional regulator NrdR family protein